MLSSSRRRHIAAILVALAGAAWLVLSVFRPVAFSAGDQSPSPRALVNPYFVFAVVLLVGLAVRSSWQGGEGGPAAHWQEKNRTTWLTGAILLLLLGVAYLNALSLSPLSDDFALLLHARHATAESYLRLFTQGQGGTMVRPLGLAALLAQYNLWGMEPEGYRVVNLLVHFLGAVGLFLLARDLAFPGRAAWAAGFLFALHPVHPESTVWIVSLITVMAGAGVIWSFHFYLRFRASGRRAHLALSLLLAAVAMLSKETGYVLPLLVAAHGVILQPEAAWRARIREWTPFAVLLLAGGFYRFWVLGGVGGYGEAEGLPGVLRFDWLKTPEALLVRAPAHALLAVNWTLSLSWLFRLLAALWMAVIVFVLARSRTASVPARHFLFFLVWTVLTALPAHNLLLVGGDLLNARNLYLPAAGGVLLVALVIKLALESDWRRGAAAAALLSVGLYAVALHHNLWAWHLASRSTREILQTVEHTVPRPPPGARFWIVGLPEALHGVYINTGELQPALRLMYDRRDIRSRVFPSFTDLPPVGSGVFVFFWDGEKRELEPLAGYRAHAPAREPPYRF